VEKGWHCEGAAAYACARLVQVVEVGKLTEGFPRVYRLSKSSRRFHFGLGGFFAVASVLAGSYFATLDDQFPGVKPMMVVICAAFFALGVYVLASALRTHVVLAVEAIELHGLFTTRQAPRGEFRGRRWVDPGHGPPVLKLLASGAEGKDLTLPQFLELDSHFEEWLSSLQDFDATERQVSLDAILADPDLRGSDGDRLRELARARRMARVVSWASIGICAWAWFYPHPYRLAISCAVLMPWVGLYLAGRHGALYRLNPTRNEVGADLSATIFAPAGALALRALSDVTHFDGWQVLVATLAGTALFTLVGLAFVRQLRQSGEPLLFAFLMLIYSYGCLVMANRELPQARPAVFGVEVRGSSSSDSNYTLELERWGPAGAPQNIDVSRDLHDRVRAGDTVCVYLWPGALEVRWLEVWDCPD
jgi:hypothetical protein